MHLILWISGTLCVVVLLCVFPALILSSQISREEEYEEFVNTRQMTLPMEGED